ncbi:MAG: bifunctional nicotinamidase/pyrazinamidase [Deltaproteobacteria bacterium]|nr:bifunctional nicotinamidase/pyrazinamidase [Deltaproteobacteria bacterium]
MPVLRVEALIDERVAALRAFHRAVGTQRAELDISGGIDSAVMLGLLARALGPAAITAVYQGIHSSQASRDRAREAAAAFGVPLIEVDLSAVFDALVREMRAGMGAVGLDLGAVEARCAADPTVLGSLRSCLRAPVGRGFNRLAGGGVRHGTGNECEDRWLRFYQKGGDGEVDTNPIAMLSKGEVYQLARALGVPRSILTAAPTPDLWAAGEAHSDEAEIDAYLGLGAGALGYRYYARVDPDTGAYLQPGLIERVARLIDDHPLGSTLFAADPPEALLDAAPAHPAMAGLEADLVRALLRAARRAERLTRHKLNPNLPALGRRADLLQAGILTDTLPLGGEALLLVDLQPDFCPGGALAVPEGDQVIAVANRLAEGAPRVVATQDWHPPGHSSFAAQGGPWPDHCVQGTPGAQLHPGLTTRPEVVIQKGAAHGADSYSGFADEDGGDTGLDAWLRGRGVERLVVLGLATDYCVRATVIDALARGYAVRVVTDGCRGVDAVPGDSARALAELGAAGAELVRSDAVRWA